jgi:hypothetical protein
LIFLSGSLYFSRIVPNKYLSKNSENCGAVFDFFPFFQLFPSLHRNLLPIQPNKYLSTKAVSGAFFSDFFRFFFREACNLPGSLRTSIFPKKPRMVRIFFIFCDLAENQLIPNKYLSKKAPNGSDFFEFSRKIFFRRLGFHTSIFPETEDRGPLFLNFFHFSFQQHGYVENASRKTKNNVI